MSQPGDPEVWLRGPLPDVIPELQPVVHSLLQVREEIAGVATLPDNKLWTKPGGAASIGFHLLHLAGSLDRLLTYARGKVLNAAQRAALEAEASGDTSQPAADLVRLALEAIDRCASSRSGRRRSARWTRRARSAADASRPPCWACCSTRPNTRSAIPPRSSRRAR